MNHTFKAHVNWKASKDETTIDSKSYNRAHIVKIDNKTFDLKMSAAKMFRGDSELYNPEDLLLSALASCHMMSYLYMCSQNNIEVLSYTDNAEAILEVESSGSGHFTKATLNPIIKIKDEAKKKLALSLHEKANSLCFIANSCNFPITHNVQVLVEDK
ncbi:OsmC family protein [Thalassobellus sediminis]|uniref:OsmC family protein n=1 Tax=Thalassobellus sediminis TaxID=3367753 RepID=UPI003799C79F